MNKEVAIVILLVSFATALAGCSGSNQEVETTAEHDALSEWVEANPEPEEIDPDAE